MENQVLEKVRRTVQKYKMLEPGDRVVIGVSGGIDSVVLLHVLRLFSGEYGLYLHVAHLNHMFRGKEAEEDARFVEDLAKSLDLPVTIESFDVHAYAERTGLSSQVAARQVRYDFYRRVARKEEACKIALGHHADDQAETVLMRFLRGSGTTGLAGIPPVRHEVFHGVGNLTIIRPLIRVTRAEIQEYCESTKLTYRVDASNVKPCYLRNRVRLELIPFLEREYNPGLRRSLARIADFLRAEDDYLTEKTEEVLASMKSAEKLSKDEAKVELDLRVFLEQPFALRRRVVRMVANLLLTGGLEGWGEDTVIRGRDGHPEGGYKEGYVEGYLEDVHVEGAISLAENSPSGSFLELPGGICVKKEYGKLIMKVLRGRGKAKQAPAGAVRFEYNLIVPGITEIPELGFEIEARVEAMPEGENPAGMVVGPYEAILDYDRIGDGELLRVRSRRPGDKFHPLGMAGTKKIKDFFIDAKVPREIREKAPVVVAEDKILWLAGYRIDDRFKVTRETRRILRLLSR